MVTSTDINFECLQCGQPLVVDSTAQGQRLPCPNCKCELTVPKLPPPEEVETSFPAALSAYLQPSSPAVLAAGSTGHAEVMLEELVVARKDSDKLQAQLAERTASTEQLWSEMRQQQLEKESLVLALNQRTEEFGDVQAQMARRQEEMAVLQAAMEVVQQKQAALEEELAGRERALAEAGQAHATTKDVLEEAELKIRALERELGERQQDFERRGQRIQELEPLQTALEASRAETREVETAKADLLKTLATLRAENAQLREGLEGSTAGREMMRLRERVEAAEAEAQKALRAQQHAEDEQKKAQLSEERWKSTVDNLRSQYAAVERHRGDDVTSATERENTTLRSLVERQKEDLAKCYAEAKKFKSARMKVRLVLALALLGIAVALFFGVQVLQHVLKLG